MKEKEKRKKERDRQTESETNVYPNRETKERCLRDQENRLRQIKSVHACIQTRKNLSQLLTPSLSLSLSLSQCSSHANTKARVGTFPLSLQVGIHTHVGKCFGRLCVFPAMFLPTYLIVWQYLPTTYLPVLLRLYA